MIFSFRAMSMAVPEVADHPNRKPFSGVLARVGKPSDEPPGGSGGKRVILPPDVAQAAIPSIIGMAVDTDPDGAFDGHDPQCKIGLITGAHVEGDALCIEGFFYAGDFPELYEIIQAQKERLGFSYEVQVHVKDMDAKIWEISACTFTGAALLYKDKAAYRTTSLAAHREEDDDMKETDVERIVAKALEPILATIQAQAAELTNQVAELKASRSASLAGPIIDQTTPHVEACNACADALDAAGIGGHPVHGYAAALRRIGANMLHTATMGVLPQEYDGHHPMEARADRRESVESLQARTAVAVDKRKSLETQVADLEAELRRLQSDNVRPIRRTTTLSAEAREVLDKFALRSDPDKPLTVSAVDEVMKAAGLSGSDSIAVKLKLRAAGQLQ